MKKKLLAFAAAAVMAFSQAAPAVIAEDVNPTVFVDSREVYFPDQKPVIKDDRTLVPARAVFEQMGASVDWDADTRTVYIESSDHIIRIYITIDSAQMKVETFTTSIYTPEESNVTLDVPAQIINDRTMVPLRAISEALKCDVAYEDATKEVIITTLKKETPTAAPSGTGTSSGTDTSSSGTDASSSPTQAPESSDLPVMYITSDKTTAAAGEEITVYVNLKNLPKENNPHIINVAAGIYYDNTVFEFVSMSAVSDGEVIDSSKYIGGSNPNFKDDSLKTTYVYLDPEIGASEDGVVMELKFKSIAGGAGTFTLSSRVTDRSNDTMFIIKTKSGDKYTDTAFRTSDEFTIDRTPININ